MKVICLRDCTYTEDAHSVKYMRVGDELELPHYVAAPLFRTKNIKRIHDDAIEGYTPVLEKDLYFWAVKRVGCKWEVGNTATSVEGALEYARGMCDPMDTYAAVRVGTDYPVYQITKSEA